MGPDTRIDGDLPPSVDTDDDRAGTWADTGYRATDEEAHRNVRYNGASPMSRVITVYMTQMKLFSKNRWLFILIFAAILMPVITAILPEEFFDILLGSSAGSTQYIGILLSMMPLMVAFFTSMLCGTQIPNEFKERTAYMSIPLPVSRLEFYIGKYLAGFTVCVGVFLMAFGFAIAMAMGKYDLFFSDLIAESLLITAVSIFAYSATAYCIGTFMSRGSSMVPFMLMMIILPAALIVIGSKLEILDTLILLPCFLPDATLNLLGSPLWFSIYGVGGSLLGALDMSMIGTMVLIGIVWGALFLAIGAYRTIRREM